jgi:hypothetical protein
LVQGCLRSHHHIRATFSNRSKPKQKARSPSAASHPLAFSLQAGAQATSRRRVPLAPQEAPPPPSRHTTRVPVASLGCAAPARRTWGPLGPLRAEGASLVPSSASRPDTWSARTSRRLVRHCVRLTGVAAGETCVPLVPRCGSGQTNRDTGSVRIHTCFSGSLL